MTFQRESRYIVVKLKDLAPGQEADIREHLTELSAQTVDSLVIERDWPEYEPAWRMIQARVEGATLSPAHIEDGEEVEVVAHLIIPTKGTYKGRQFAASGPVPAERSPLNDYEPLMTVAQHQRMTAALVARNEWLEQVAVEAAETEKHALQVADAYRNGAALSAPPAAGVPDSAYARRIIEAGEKLYNELRQWLATESDPDSQAALQEWREIRAPTPPASEQQRAVGLDVIDKLRLELLPEYEAGYTAIAYGDTDQPVARANGMTAREAIAELLRLNPHLAKEGV